MGVCSSGFMCACMYVYVCEGVGSCYCVGGVLMHVCVCVGGGGGGGGVGVMCVYV